MSGYSFTANEFHDNLNLSVKPIVSRKKTENEAIYYKSTEAGLDNRIEIITQASHDWFKFESELLDCQLKDE